jgi:hypothetical protein
MATSKEDAQAKLSRDEILRTGYDHGTPLEGGKIADSMSVDLFDSADRIAHAADRQSNSTMEQMRVRQKIREMEMRREELVRLNLVCNRVSVTFLPFVSVI